MVGASWYTVVLAIFMLMGTLVFVGIEGKNSEFKSYQNLEEQLVFNRTLRDVRCGLVVGSGVLK